MKKNRLITTVAIALAVCLTIAGTIAWISTKTDPVKNVFTVGDNINIELNETTGGEYAMNPGKELDKDPVITVKKDSAACYLFFKAEASENLKDFIEYTVATGWTELKGVEGVTGVYYQVTTKAEKDETYHILKDDKVKVKDTVTKEELDELNEDTYPTLTFTAYAIQKDGMTDEKDAWAKLNPEEKKD